MKKVLLFSISLTLVTSILHPEETPTEPTNVAQYRHMIILTDTDTENIATDSLASLHLLASALHEKAAPILISTSLWQNFIERRQEMESGIFFPETDESKIFAFFSNYRDRIQFLSDYFSKQHNNSPEENKNLIIAKINSELQIKEMQTALNVKTIERIKSLLPFYHTPFNANDWAIKEVGNYFYLLIPNTLADEYKHAFYLDNLETIQQPDDSETLLFNNTNRPENDFIQTLSSLFKKNKTYLWNIFLMGHGNNEDLGNNNIYRKIAGLSISEFKDALQFFNDSVLTNTLIYDTCCAAGEQLQYVYDNNSKKSIYNYTIALPCLTDNPTYEYLAPVINNHGNLTESDLVYDTMTKQWQIKLYPHHWQQFFSLLQAETKDFNTDQWLELVSYIKPCCIENIPNIRKKGTDAFTIITYNKKISNLLASKKNNDPITYDGTTILLDMPIVDTCVSLDDNHDKRRIFLSVLPGNASHYFTNIQAKTFDINNLFFNLLPTLSRFEKEVLIEKLSCKINPESTEAQFLHTQGKQDLVLTKIILRMQKNNNLIRTSFQNVDGKTYCAYLMRNNKLCGLTPLTEKGAKAHENYFQRAKEKAFINHLNSSSQAKTP